jgi:hypothetical protein
LFVALGPLVAQDPLGPKVTGVVKNDNGEVGTITVRRKNAADDERFNLLKKEIEVTEPSGRKVPLDAVRTGQTVQLRVGVTGDIEAISIQPGVFLATVSDVDFKARTITIAGARPATMTVDAAAKILIVGRPAYLREVKPGSQMNVSPSLDGKTALALTLVSDPDGKLAAKLFPRVKISRLPGERFVGALTDIDPVKNALRLTGPKTKGVPRSMPVAKDVVIKAIHGQVPVQELALNQVVDQAQATVLVSVDKQVTHIVVKSPVLEGKVKSLDADGGRLTADVEGREKTFALPRDVKVMAKNRVRRLIDLEPNVAVSLVLSLDRERLLGIDIQPAAKP